MDVVHYIFRLHYVSLKIPTNKGQWVVLVHGGGENGCVLNALLMFTLGSIKNNYHNNLNFENYEMWIIEMLIPNLNKNSVIGIDKASYLSLIHI